jgi:tetratricopeptide (TPR) repeat protein
MGSSFPRSTVSAVSQLPEAQVDALLTALVRKQVLAVRADPLSPDRGQYVFAQTLLRSVAYDMLSRHERKPRHLAVATHLRAIADGDELAEVIAAHLLDAYRSAAGDPDEDALRVEALAALRRGAQRAASLGAPEAAERTYASAVELAGDDAERADLLRTAGDMASGAGRAEAALAHYEAAADALESSGDHRGALLLSAPACTQLAQLGRNLEGAERARGILEELGPDATGPEIAGLLQARGHALLFSGDFDEAEPLLQRALELAQAFELPELMTRALIQRATLCARRNRIEEARILQTGAVDVAMRHGLEPERARALMNLGDLLWRFDLPGADEPSREALSVVRRLGHRSMESIAAGNLVGVLLSYGQWDEGASLAEALLDQGGPERPERETLHFRLVALDCLRGDLDGARRHVAAMEAWRETDDFEAREMFEAAELTVALAGDPAADVIDAALARSDAPARAVGEGGRQLLPPTVDAILRLGLLDRADTLLEQFAHQPPGHVPPSARGHLARLRGHVHASRDEHAEAERELTAAVDTFATLEQPYWLAVARAGLAEWLLERGRAEDAAPLLEQAATTFQELRAAPALDRVLRLRDEQPQDAISA